MLEFELKNIDDEAIAAPKNNSYDNSNRGADYQQLNDEAITVPTIGTYDEATRFILMRRCEIKRHRRHNLKNMKF